MINRYLNQRDSNVVLDMRIPLPNISHYKITQFSTELNSCRSTSDHNKMQLPFLLFFWRACKIAYLFDLSCTHTHTHTHVNIPWIQKYNVLWDDSIKWWNSCSIHRNNGSWCDPCETFFKILTFEKIWEKEFISRIVSLDCGFKKEGVVLPRRIYQWLK